MPRYEFSEGSSNKFWEIELQGNGFTTTWGKIGTDGQSKTQTFKDASEAKKEYEKIIQSKVKKGYALADGEGGDDDAGDDGEPAEASELKSNPELEAAIARNPGDEKAWLVYGDWLQSNGDVRGELMALQAKGNTKAANKLIAQHRETLFGELAEKIFDEEGGEADEAELKELEWHLGFLVGARLCTSYDAGSDLGEMTATLLKLPVARFMRKLVWGLPSFDGDASGQGLIDAVIASPHPETLESLFITDFEYPDENEMSWSAVGDLSALWAKTPNLKTLHLRGGNGCTLGKIEAPKLTHFTHETGGMGSEELDAIAAARWPNLESLEIWFGSDGYGGTCTVDNLRPIFAGEGLSKLKILRLKNGEFANDLIEPLAKSKILKQLETVDLSMGTLFGPGIEALVKYADAFRHLKSLDLEDNFLTEEDKERLKHAKLDNVTGLESQREADDWGDDEEHRYASVGE